jgi:hypothetical protein
MARTGHGTQHASAGRLIFLRKKQAPIAHRAGRLTFLEEKKVKPDWVRPFPTAPFRLVIIEQLSTGF